MTRDETILDAISYRWTILLALRDREAWSARYWETKSENPHLNTAALPHRRAADACQDRIEELILCEDGTGNIYI